MASAITPSANKPANDLIFVHTVQLINAHFSGRMVSSVISNTAIRKLCHDAFDVTSLHHASRTVVNILN